MNKTVKIDISSVSETDIAIIGMAGRFPGAKNIEEFWQNIVNAKDSVSHFSDDQLREAGIEEPLIQNPHYVKVAGILDEIDLFDANFFGMTPHEASITDPQHRVFLEICWEALAVAGYTHRETDLSVGVFAGMSDSTYLQYCLLKNKNFLSSSYPYQTHIASSGHFLATKVSYHLNLTGPSININTACSTSLVSVITACQSLLTSECDMAIAGGISLRIPQVQGYLYQEGGILSKDGKCRAFDADATGTVSSSGAGVVVLKRLHDALKDKDNIEVVIKGYGINNDGANKVSYTAPSMLEQSRCIASALANIDAESIGYVEAHGTGTALGDPIEIAALTKAFRHYTSKKNYCAVGSVKTNIGHANIAAGIAGLIKTVLVLKNRIIPPTLYFQKANAHINFSDSPFYVNNTLLHWKKNDWPRRAGVSSLGIGGTNAHIVLEEGRAYHADRSYRRISLPFEKKRYWVDPLIQDKDEEVIAGRPSLYQSYWEVSSLGGKNKLNRNENWLVFIDTLGVSENLIRHLQALKQNVVVVCSGHSFDKVDENFYKINFSSQNDYQDLFESLKKENSLPSYILHCLSLSQFSSIQNKTLSEQTLTDNFLSLIYIAKAFFGSSEKDPVDMLILTNYSQKIFSDEPIVLSRSILQGPCLVIPQEYKDVSCRIIDVANIEKINQDELSKRVVNEIFQDVKHNIIAYRSEHRFIKQYKKCRDLYQKDNHLLKEKGVYLIVGAFGNVGMHLIEYLADYFCPHLVLVSRSFSYPSQSSKAASLIEHLERIEKKLSSLHVMQADATDLEQMRGIFESIQKTHGRINGVFYLAAAARLDSIKVLMNDIQIQHVKEQFAPKVEGIEVMRELVSHFPVDFCCLYSSLSAILGGVGLASYAASNAYLDSVALSLYQSDSKTQWISINWDAIEAFNGFTQMREKRNTLKKLQKKDLGYSLGAILNQAPPLLSNFLVSTEKLEERWDQWINPSKSIVDNFDKKDALSDTYNQKVLQYSITDIQEGVTRAFEVCLGLTHIGKEQSFYDLGGDSLMAIGLLDQLEKIFDIRLKLNDLVEYNTIQDLSAFIRQSMTRKVPDNPYIVKLNAIESKQAVFLVHPVGGAVFCYMELAKKLSYTLYGIQDPHMDASHFTFHTVAEMAAAYVQHVLTTQPEGEYYIGGFSFGGSIAFEMARQLQEMGKQIKIVFIIDAWAAFAPEIRNYDTFCQSMQHVLKDIGQKVAAFPERKRSFLDLAWCRMNVLLDYCPDKQDLPVVLFKAQEILEEYRAVEEETNHWQHYTSNLLAVHVIEGNHETLLKLPESAKKIADLMSKCII